MSQPESSQSNQLNPAASEVLQEAQESVPKVGDIPKTGGIITDSRVFGRKNALEMAGICPMAAKIEFVQTYGTDSKQWHDLVWRLIAFSPCVVWRCLLNPEQQLPERGGRGRFLLRLLWTGMQRP